MSAFENPLRAGPVILVAAVGGAEGSRPAAAALACAGSDVGRASLLIDLGGRSPRPALVASVDAHRLEERFVAHLPQARLAARGATCHLSVPADPDGLIVAASAAAVARAGAVVVHVPPALLPAVVEEGLGSSVSGALLRADLGLDRALTALVARDLMARDLAVAVLKRRLGWVVERRALFGALQPQAGVAIPVAAIRRLLPGFGETGFERSGGEWSAVAS